MIILIIYIIGMVITPFLMLIANNMFDLNLFNRNDSFSTNIWAFTFSSVIWPFSLIFTYVSILTKYIK